MFLIFDYYFYLKVNEFLIDVVSTSIRRRFDVRIGVRLTSDRRQIDVEMIVILMTQNAFSDLNHL